tara:strand:+ start:1819 stop:2445 length:627 start_codon:yes stop_codon:yes gene_type:complete
MPYCTIEEAWTQSLNPELQENETKPLEYQSENTDLFKLDNKPKKIVKRIPQKSRTYKVLDQHYAKKDRQQKKIKKVIIDDKESEEGSVDYDYQYGYNNNKNEFNINAYNEYNNKAKDLDSNVSVMEDFKDDIPNNNSNNNQKSDQSQKFIDIINELRQENKKLGEKIEELRNNSHSKKDNFMEILMFILTGVIIILMMENINKLVRRF